MFAVQSALGSLVGALTGRKPGYDDDMEMGELVKSDTCGDTDDDEESRGLLDDRDPNDVSQRILWARTAPPQILHFVLPEKHRPGMQVCIQGPHGPMHIMVSEGMEPGQQCTMRLQPQDVLNVTVPDDAKPGDLIVFEAVNGEMQRVQVPLDIAPGETFEVAPAAVMVERPHTSRSCDKVKFELPDGTVKVTNIPWGVQPGHYFAYTF